MTHMIPEAGKRYARKDMKAVYEGELWLSDLDSPDNYILLSEEEASKLKEGLEGEEGR